MPDCEIRIPARSRRLSRGLLVSGWLIALSMIYVASVGPMAMLESQGLGTDSTWDYLRRTLYQPIYFAWTYGPNWVSSPVSRYVKIFEIGSSKCQSLGSEHNDLLHQMVVWKRAFEKRNLVQLEWEKSHPQEAQARREAEEGVFCSPGDPLTDDEIRDAEESWWWSPIR